MPIGTSRSGGGAFSGAIARGFFKHHVIDITPADILQKDFLLPAEAVPGSELVCYNLSVLCPSEDGSPRDYSMVDNKILRLVPEFVLLPGDRLHIYFQPL